MPTTGELPLLIATDLDGTLLGRDGSISARTQQTLHRARAAGIELVMVTGRPARHVAKIAGVAALGGLVICVNGAMTYDLDRQQVVRETRLAAGPACEVIAKLRRHVPGISFAVEVGLEYGWEPSYGEQRAHREAPQLPVADAVSLCRNGVNKLIAGHTDFTAEQLIDLTESLIRDQAWASYSGAPFVEISALQVSKATALAEICAERGIEPARVLSFGDMPNDLPMLKWAGQRVAMANAHPSVLAAVDEVTLSNEADGVAVVLERLLRG